MDGCSDVDVSDISNCLEVNNNGGYAALTDEEIITSCSKQGDQ